ncbi:hypothetical protein E4Z66_11290 [Aliishimia ponticola]|uniref:Uncharacterized protein n=1 Tax=Aliishimia ponticola TaxID=2499833 RepID=A0A4V3XK57_9RHOB|nr:DUF6476 family protein [Aliishimia ponticola]THH35673.1 hypothetical protein E4Z66_11290 [Aliishimia ponticola]
MDDLPQEPRNLRFLRYLVTGLTATMILGVAAIVVMLFLRLNDKGPALPDRVSLPQGMTAAAVTMGEGWYAVVADDQTGGQRILIFDAESGALRQTVEIEN